MKQALFVLVVLILLSFFSPLCAQLQLDWDLVIESVNGTYIDMRLDVVNNTDEDWNYNFGSAAVAFYSIDGQIHTGMLLPMVLPYTLEAGASDSFDLFHSGYLDPGPHTVQAHLNISVDDAYLPVGEPEIVLIEDFIPITMGDGSEPARVPIDFYWRNSLYQCIYTPADYGWQPGTLMAVSFHTLFEDVPYNNFMAQQIQLYLMETGLNNLNGGWSTTAGILAQFNSLMDFPAGNHEIRFNLRFPIQLDGYNNLLMIMFRPMHSSYQFTADPFMADECPSNMALNRWSDSINIDPSVPLSLLPSHFCDRKPMTTFYIIPNGDPVSASEDVAPALAPTISVYPNPFRQGCELKLDKPLQTPGSLKIYDIKGRLIRTLEQSSSEAFHWDGKNSDGKSCPAGLYLYQADLGSTVARGKMIRL